MGLLDRLDAISENSVICEVEKQRQSQYQKSFNAWKKFKKDYWSFLFEKYRHSMYPDFAKDYALAYKILEKSAHILPQDLLSIGFTDDDDGDFLSAAFELSAQSSLFVPSSSSLHSFRSLAPGKTLVNSGDIFYCIGNCEGGSVLNYGNIHHMGYGTDEKKNLLVVNYGSMHDVVNLKESVIINYGTIDVQVWQTKTSLIYLAEPASVYHCDDNIIIHPSAARFVLNECNDNHVFAHEIWDSSYSFSGICSYPLHLRPAYLNYHHFLHDAKYELLARLFSREEDATNSLIHKLGTAEPSRAIQTLHNELRNLEGKNGNANL